MNRAGMTLIELLAALGLSALLMAVLFSVVAQHSKTSEILRREKPFEPWRNILRNQLESDYSGCRHVVVRPNRVVIEGYANNHADTSATDGPTRIEYYLVAGEDGNRLFRTQENLLSNQISRYRTDLVCRDVSRISTETRLSTDVAPGILSLKLEFTEDSNVRPLQVSLVRHGGAP